MMASIHHLPDEVVILLLRLLDDMDVFALCRVNRRLRRLARDPLLWQRLYTKRWGNHPQPSKDWYSAYLRLVRAEKYSSRVFPVPNVTAIARTAEHVFVGLGSGGLTKFHPVTGHIYERLLGCHHQAIASLTVSPCGERLASGSADASVRVWQARDLGEELQHVTAAAAVSCVRWVDTHRLLFSTTSLEPNQTLKIYDLQALTETTLASTHRGAVRTVACSADGNLVLSAGDDKDVICWDLRVALPVARCRGHVQGITSCDMDASGLWAVTASLDRTVKEWDLRKSRESRSHEAHSEAVLCVAADAGKVISGSVDCTLKEASRKTHDWRTIAGHTAPVRCLTVHNREIFSASSDGTVRQWTLYYPM